MSDSRRFFATEHPAKVAAIGYMSYIAIGWLVLCLPFSQTGTGVSALDNLFIATSAVSTTGLVPVSVADCYSFVGQFVILLLIQLGGIGYMTFGSFVILSRQTNLSSAREGVGNVVFSLPESFRIDKFIRSVVVFTAVIEACGACALYFALRDVGAPNALWSAIFHSVSAFCTAGFSIYSSGFVDYAGSFWINAILSILSYLGAIGFIVCVDAWRRFRGKSEQMTLTSRIILWATVWLTAGGTILFFLVEPSIQGFPLDKRLLAAFFQVMTSITTVGFNTIDVGQLSKASVLLLITLMVIGSSPSGTGGGLKSTTFTAILGVMRSAIHGEREVRFWGNVVPLQRVWTAVASLGFYLSVLLVGTFLLELIESTPFDENFFEAASALGTVGLSMGVTPELSDIGKLVVVLLMFCGRLGPLTFGIALFFRPYPARTTASDNDLAV